MSEGNLENLLSTRTRLMNDLAAQVKRLEKELAEAIGVAAYNTADHKGLIRARETISIANATYDMLSKQLGAAQQQVKTLREALPPARRLRTLADMVDYFYPDDPEPEIQDDLRKWASKIDALATPSAEEDNTFRRDYAPSAWTHIPGFAATREAPQQPATETVCPQCSGKRVITSFDGLITKGCPTCNGSGKIQIEESIG